MKLSKFWTPAEMDNFAEPRKYVRAQPATACGSACSEAAVGANQSFGRPRASDQVSRGGAVHSIRFGLIHRWQQLSRLRVIAEASLLEKPRLYSNIVGAEPLAPQCHWCM